MKKLTPVAFGFLAVVAFIFTGCDSDSAEPASSSHSSARAQQTSLVDNDQSHGDRAAHMEMEGEQSEIDKMNAELAKLSPEDRESVEKQQVCPISGKMLGTMGPPYKVEVDGQQVWLCCPRNEEQFFENPDEFLAKLQQ